jgi:hypothetical protein
MAQIIKPGSTDTQKFNVGIFLAGSIEMGAAEEWQKRVENEFKDVDVTFFNPRRDDWDSSWSHDSVQFNEQVNWEMNAMENCGIIFMNFSPETKSPISLLELGLHANDRKMIVCCPDEFWRKGNVGVVCTRYNIPLFEDFNKALFALRTKILEYGI